MADEVNINMDGPIVEWQIYEFDGGAAVEFLQTDAFATVDTPQIGDWIKVRDTLYEVLHRAFFVDGPGGVALYVQEVKNLSPKLKLVRLGE